MNEEDETLTNRILTPSRTIVTSFSPRQKASAPVLINSIDNDSKIPTSTFDEGDWVLCLAASCSSSVTDQNSTISCALSNGNILVYDRSRLLPVVSYRHEQNSNAVVTDMIYRPNDLSTLLTTGMDGSFVIKDFRQQSNLITQGINICTVRESHNESLLSLALGFDGYIVALASSKGYIHFVDLRKMISPSGSTLLLGSYVNSHHDAITMVEFHPDKRSILMSAGEDGLMCIYNTTQPSEEQAIETVINTGSPCRKARFCGSNIFCFSGSETASMWDWNTGIRVNDGGNFHLRDNLSAIATMPINYLIDAQWDPDNLHLSICAGNYDGNVAIFSYDDQHNNNVPWEVSDLLIGGHQGMIRAWCPTKASMQIGSDSATSVIFTAGEDARICEWKRFDRSIRQHESCDDSTIRLTSVNTKRVNTSPNSGGPIRRQRRGRNSSLKPY
jgi:WD repeat-containing protein 89